jgi:hypothetical protein
MKAQEWQATVIETTAKTLAHALATTQPDRQDWRPSLDETSKTRSALDQITECIEINRMAAALVQGKQPAARTGDRTFGSAEEAGSQLLASASELAAAVRGLSDEQFEASLTTHRGPMQAAAFISRVTGNMAYHSGQINFIQTLYGDTEFHVPAQ